MSSSDHNGGVILCDFALPKGQESYHRSGRQGTGIPSQTHGKTKQRYLVDGIPTPLKNDGVRPLG